MLKSINQVDIFLDKIELNKRKFFNEYDQNFEIQQRIENIAVEEEQQELQESLNIDSSSHAKSNSNLGPESGRNNRNYQASQQDVSSSHSVSIEANSLPAGSPQVQNHPLLDEIRGSPRI